MESFICGCRIGTADRCGRPDHGDRLGTGRSMIPPRQRGREPAPIDENVAYTGEGALDPSFDGWAYLRDPIKRFALTMEGKLRMHDAERGEMGWRGGDQRWGLWDRLNEEMKELYTVVSLDDRNEIRSEAADVANFAMMLADHVGALRFDAPGIFLVAPPTRRPPDVGIETGPYPNGTQVRILSAQGELVEEGIYHGNLERWHVRKAGGPWDWSLDVPGAGASARMEIQAVGNLGQRTQALLLRQVEALEAHIRELEDALHRSAEGGVQGWLDAHLPTDPAATARVEALLASTPKAEGSAPIVEAKPLASSGAAPSASSGEEVRYAETNGGGTIPLTPPRWTQKPRRSRRTGLLRRLFPTWLTPLE